MSVRLYSAAEGQLSWTCSNCPQVASGGLSGGALQSLYSVAVVAV